ncbi:MAG: glycosyltransferase [Acidobacteriota bacterium]|nr:glycosyltransferase [Acidobacteriota bacterium]
MQPKVSVIIPAYNSAQFIAEAIQSVLAQSYDNREIIIVDDGSTDATLDVLRGFGEQIKLLTKTNGGPASARNLAIRHASGKYIAFLDADDLWMPEKLAEQVAFLESQPEVGMTFSEALMFIEPFEEVGGEKQIRGKIGFTGETSFCHLLLGDHIPNSTVLMRRECVDKIGWLNESRALVAVEDYEYWLRLAKAFPIRAISKPLAYYRVHANNLMGDGEDIERSLILPIIALNETEKLFPDCWRECGMEKDVLFARLTIRAGFAYKQRGDWWNCLRKFRQALGHRCNLRVLRWIVAATLLKRWS